MRNSANPSKFVVRLPDGMRESIQRQAEANRRSMNSEIVHVLDCALASNKAKGPASVGALPDQEHLTHP